MVGDDRDFIFRNRGSSRLRKNYIASQNFTGPHVLDKPGLSDYLVCLVHLVSLMQPNKPDRPNRPNEQDRLADFFSILIETDSVESKTADGETIVQIFGRTCEYHREDVEAALRAFSRVRQVEFLTD